MPHPSLPPAIDAIGATLRACSARRADPAHRQARAEARAGHDTASGAGRTEHDQGQSRQPLPADTIGGVTEHLQTDMTYAQTARAGKLDELRTLASHLTAGSLLQAVTLQLIAEQENAARRQPTLGTAALTPAS